MNKGTTMCILFLYVNNNPTKNGYQLIIANNRDEMYTRPTKSAARWTNAPHCISGLDWEPSREGGTWLGLSDHGKFASLMNILCENNSRHKKGRGFLVTDYLAGTDSARDYTGKLAKDRHDYNPFNLVTLEKPHGNWELRYFSSNDETSPFDLDIVDRIHAFGNSALRVPWKKVTDGKEIFTRITDQYSTVADKSKLTEELLDMLNDPTPHFPDPQLESQASHLDAEVTTQRSGLCVCSPQIEYGSRTNTLILVDADGGGEYIERTMRAPVDPYHPVWDTVTIDFKL